MEVMEAHKPLLRQLGLEDDDFARFDGTYVRYEFDPKLGVRIYDPYYTTSYNEYIGIDGWSAWSSENDTFMSDILRDSHGRVTGKEAPRAEADMEAISKALQKKFDKDPGKAPK
jgi:hypothetical protein